MEPFRVAVVATLGGDDPALLAAVDGAALEVPPALCRIRYYFFAPPTVADIEASDLVVLARGSSLPPGGWVAAAGRRVVVAFLNPRAETVADVVSRHLY